MTGQEIMQGLIDRGYTPYHAAALAGHAIQESGGNPENVNAKEGAHGLWQWRGDRWTGLQNYAVSRNSSPTDPQVQLDYVAKEMAGPEAKSGAAFMAAGDLPSASAALKRYIRWGDNSDETRLKNAQALLQGGGGGSGGTNVPTAGPKTASAPAGNPTSPAVPPAPEDTGLTAALQAIPKQLAAQQTEAPQLAPLEIQPPPMTPAMIRARQMAAAMMAKPLTPPGTFT